MSVTLLIAAAGFAATTYLAVSDHRAANLARRNLLNECADALGGAQISHGEDGFPRLAGFHMGHRIRADLLPDTMTIRRLPQLWLSTTLMAANSHLPRLAVLVRPAGTEFYSLTSYLPERFEAPAGFPPHVAIRGDGNAAPLLAELSATLAEILADPRVKEVAISERGLRIVRQAAEGKRGEYLLLRQSVFERTVVPLEEFQTSLENLETLRRITSSHHQAWAA